MSTINLLYAKQYAINNSIRIVIPTVGQILGNEDAYYSLVSIFTAMPIDLMCQLDDVGIDFTSINEYELFLLMFEGLKSQDTSLIFDNLDLSKFKVVVNGQNGSIVLFDSEHNIIIDRAIYNQIASVLRRIHHLEKNNRKPANNEARDYMLKRAREKMRRKNRKEESYLESLIIAMVNTEQYKYNFEGTKNLTIYQFNESVKQVVKKVDYDKRMIGVYAGTVNIKELSQDDLNWLIHK